MIYNSVILRSVEAEIWQRNDASFWRLSALLIWFNTDKWECQQEVSSQNLSVISRSQYFAWHLNSYTEYVPVSLSVAAYSLCVVQANHAVAVSFTVTCFIRDSHAATWPSSICMHNSALLDA